MIDLGYPDFFNVEQKNLHAIDFMDYLNNESIELINVFYHFGFELFDYVKI